MTTTLPITKARENLPRLVDNVKNTLSEYIITVNGLPAAVLISAAEYESWKETNEIVANSDLLKAIKEGEDDLEKGQFVTFDQLKKDLSLHV